MKLKGDVNDDYGESNGYICALCVCVCVCVRGCVVCEVRKRL